MNDFEFIIANLKQDIQVILHLHDRVPSCDEEYRNLLRSLLTVLEYYCTDEEYSRFYESFKPGIDSLLNPIHTGSVGLEIIEMTDNPDGSTNMVFDMDEESRNFFIGQGVNFMFIKTILCNASTDQILKWSQIGKQEENTECLVDTWDY